MSVAVVLPTVTVVSVAAPDCALISPRAPVADTWETISRNAVPGISVAEAGPAESAVPELVRVTVAESRALLIVEAALEVRLFPRVVESFPLGVDAAASVAPRLDVVVRLRRAVRAAKIGLCTVISARHQP